MKKSEELEEVIITCDQEYKEPEKRGNKTIRISMFFDGTGNNRTNTNFRLKDDGASLKRKKTDGYLKAVVNTILQDYTEAVRESFNSYQGQFIINRHEYAIYIYFLIRQ